MPKPPDVYKNTDCRYCLTVQLCYNYPIETNTLLAKNAARILLYNGIPERKNGLAATLLQFPVNPCQTI